jgi:ribose transport system permease protein
MTGRLRRAIGRYWLIYAVVLVILLFAAFRPRLVASDNIAVILGSASIMAIMILGLTWVIAAGKIDVSFVQITALANMTTAGLLSAGASWTVSAICGIVIGLIVGAINGFLVGYARLSPLIVTIASGGICASAAAAVGKGTSLRISDAGALGRFLATDLGPIPLVAIAATLLYILAWWMQERLAFGHYIYATEQNEEAVVEAGIPANRLILILFVISGLSSAVAGVMLAARLSSGQPMIGASYFIDGLTAAYLGGMMIRIGHANVIGTATAVILLAVLVSGGALFGWPDYQYQIIKGGLLFVGVVIAVTVGRRTTPIRRGFVA